MNQRKRFFRVFIGLCLVSSLCACKKTQDHAPSAQPEQTDVQSAKAAAPKSLSEFCQNYKAKTDIPDHWDCVGEALICMNPDGCTMQTAHYPKWAYFHAWNQDAPKEFDLLPQAPSAFSQYQLDNGNWRCTKEFCDCGPSRVNQNEFCYENAQRPCYGKHCEPGICTEDKGCPCADTTAPAGTVCKDGKIYCHRQPMNMAPIAAPPSYVCSPDAPMLLCNDANGCACGANTCALGMACIDGDCFCGNQRGVPDAIANDMNRYLCDQGQLQCLRPPCKCADNQCNASEICDDGLCAKFFSDDGPVYNITELTAPDEKPEMIGENRYAYPPADERGKRFCGDPRATEPFTYQICQDCSDYSCFTYHSVNACAPERAHWVCRKYGGCRLMDKTYHYGAAIDRDTTWQQQEIPPSCQSLKIVIDDDNDDISAQDRAAAALQPDDYCLSCLAYDKKPVDLSNQTCVIGYKHIEACGEPTTVGYVKGYRCTDPAKCTDADRCASADGLTYDAASKQCTCGAYTVAPDQAAQYTCRYGFLVCNQKDGCPSCPYQHICP